MLGSDTSAAGAAQVAPTASAPFHGFRRPNYTPVPDELFDELLVELSGGELKVLLYIIRRTFGFKRDSDAISLSQMLNGIRTQDGRVLDRGVGLSKKTLLLALRTLQERGIIQTERRQSPERGNEPTIYRVTLRGDEDRPDEPDPAPPTPAPGGSLWRRHAGNGARTRPSSGQKLYQGAGGANTPVNKQELPLALGEVFSPAPRGGFSATQETEKQKTVEGHPAARQTVDQQTPPVSNSFELLANMQQAREPSRFSKPTRFDAVLQRAKIALRASSTAGGAEVSAPSVSPPDHQPTPAPVRPAPAAGAAIGVTVAASAEVGHAPERPKTGRRRPQTAEPASEPARAADAPPETASASPRFAPRHGHQQAPPPAPLRGPQRAPRQAVQRPQTPAGTAPNEDTTRRAHRPPPPPLSPYLEGLVTRYSEELHDEEHIPQNLGQAGRLWQASGWSESDFIHALHEAKAITVKRDVKKRAVNGGEFGARNKMPYYFKVLRDVLGLKPPTQPPAL